MSVFDDVELYVISIRYTYIVHVAEDGVLAPRLRPVRVGLAEGNVGLARLIFHVEFNFQEYECGTP